MDEHIKFVLEHDGMFPESGFGGCSCDTCEAIRRHFFDKLKQALKKLKPIEKFKASAERTNTEKGT
jgi:hypothetical protein